MTSHIMSSYTSRAGRWDEFADQIHARESVTAEFVAAIAATACARLSASYRRATSARVGKLIESEAWVEAALALVESGLPSWKLRRLVYDEGQWHCALSRQRELPEWLDQAAEASHPDLPLAVLGAFVDAMREDEASRETRVSIAPRMRPLQADLMCCDNFA